MKNRLKELLTKDIDSGKLQQELDYLEGNAYLQRFTDLLSYVESKPKSVEITNLSEFIAAVPNLTEEEILSVVRVAKAQIEKLEVA